MFRQIPIILGVIAIVGLTIAEAKLTGRFEGSDMTEQQFADLLKNVPEEIGDWRGENRPVTEEVRKTAGARGYVSRVYTNETTKQQVTVWLIVGHSRDIMRHTPDICYPSSGFKMRAPENSRQTFNFDGQPKAEFYTNTFVKEDTATGRSLERVFWSWYKPNSDGKVEWEAPKVVRWEFGNAPSLYKLYFSSQMKDLKETTDDSPCMKFAEEFLPVVDSALSTTGKHPSAETEVIETPAEPATT